MRAVGLFVVAMLLGACTHVHQHHTTVEAPTSYAAEAADLTAKSVALVLETPRGVRAFCSGVWVSPTLILTANHCVEDEELGAIVGYALAQDALTSEHAAVPAYTPHVAKVLEHDAANDIALLHALAPPSHGIAPIGHEPIVPGMFCQAMGHPLGLYFAYSHGTVAALRMGGVEGILSDTTKWVQATAPISPGNSGGGLFAADGSLIGITSAGATRGQNLNVFVHRDHLAALLKAHVP
jgi:S1-C subfamily serine protease